MPALFCLAASRSRHCEAPLKPRPDGAPWRSGRVGVCDLGGGPFRAIATKGRGVGISVPGRDSSLACSGRPPCLPFGAQQYPHLVIARIDTLRLGRVFPITTLPARPSKTEPNCALRLISLRASPPLPFPRACPRLELGEKLKEDFHPASSKAAPRPRAEGEPWQSGVGRPDPVFPGIHSEEPRFIGAT